MHCTFTIFYHYDSVFFSFFLWLFISLYRTKCPVHFTKYPKRANYTHYVRMCARRDCTLCISLNDNRIYLIFVFSLFLYYFQSQTYKHAHIHTYDMYESLAKMLMHLFRCESAVISNMSCICCMHALICCSIYDTVQNEKHTKVKRTNAQIQDK